MDEDARGGVNQHKTEKSTPSRPAGGGKWGDNTMYRQALRVSAYMRTAAPAVRVPCRVRPWLLAGRQGALPGAPLMTSAADVQEQAAPALVVRVLCRVRP